MPTYVMSDIHGEMDRFDAMLNKISFTEQDTLYILGDVVDRGADGIALLRKIMTMPNVYMTLGNHEDMMLRYFSPNATQEDAYRWSRNGCQPTLNAMVCLHDRVQARILDYLQALPTHYKIHVNQTLYYLVHAFPGKNHRDEVWYRPEVWEENPVSPCRVIIGHTPVVIFGRTDEERRAQLQRYELDGDHMRILHASGFTCIDCGCGHNIPGKALACLRLEDWEEFYI